MSYFTETFDFILESKDKKYTKESIRKEIEQIESQREPSKVFRGLWNLTVHLLQSVIIVPAAMKALSSMIVISVTALVGSALTIPSKKKKLQELKAMVIQQDVKNSVMMSISGNDSDVKAYKSYHKELQECIRILDEVIDKM